MKFFKDKFGRTIRLTDERLQHISDDHQELSNPASKIEEALMFPLIVMKSEDDEYVWLYYRPDPLSSKDNFLLVVIKISNGEGFVITAFYVKNIKEGEVVWKG